jgi:membrane protein
MNLKALFDLLKQAFQQFGEDKVPRLGAALAYYTVFSLAPLLVVLISIVGLVYGQQAAQGQIAGQIEGAVGPDAANTIQTMVGSTADKQGSGIVGTVVGVVTLVLGAAGLFGQLKDALNTVWNVEPPPSQGILGYVRSQFLSFTAVLGTGFLLLVSMVLSALLNAFSGYLASIVPGLDVLLQVANNLVSFGIVTLLFAMIYKILPDAEIEWRDVWIGAAITALLFVVGKFLIGLYLGYSAPASAYGAAGSLVVLLLWVYYSAQILLFGAELTQVQANSFGSRMTSDAGAAKGREPTVAPPLALQGPTRSGEPLTDASTPQGPTLSGAPLAAVPSANGSEDRSQDGQDERGVLVRYAPPALVGLVVGFLIGRRAA